MLSISGERSATHQKPESSFNDVLEKFRKDFAKDNAKEVSKFKWD